MSADLHLLEAHTAVALLRAGEVTPAQLLDVVEQRIQATEDLVHATPTTCFERARRAAAALRVPACPPLGYLYGLPVLIKDTTPVEGVRFTEGCLLYADRIAEESAQMVRALEAQGAIVVGKTNVPEFAAGSQSFNALFPTTVSPWDTRTTAGGSSGGAAAALAACQCWLATGSDLGGSLRTPAAFCGVVGVRPSLGLVPRDGPSGPRRGLHATNGPMGRSVRDAALLLDALLGLGTGLGWDFAGPAPPDGGFEAAAARGATRALESGSSLALRVAFSSLGCQVAPPCDALCRAAASRLAAATAAPGASATCPELPDDALDVAAAEAAFYALRGERFAADFRELLADPATAGVLKPEIAWNAAIGDVPEAAGLADGGRRQLERLEAQMQAVFDRVDVLCAPATLDAAFDAEVRYPSEQVGQAFSNYLGWMKPAYIGTVLLCPALVMPCGFLADGRPVGVQLLAAPGNDAMLFEAAALLEAVLGLPKACPEPREGSGPLRTVGPRTAEEAARHHSGEVQRYVQRYSSLAE